MNDTHSLVWVVISHGDAGAFASYASSDQTSALNWASANETHAPVSHFLPDQETGSGWIWFDSADGPPALTVRVTPLPIESP